MLMKSDFKYHPNQVALQREIFHILSALVTLSGKPEDATGHTWFRTDPLLPLYRKGLRITGAQGSQGNIMRKEATKKGHSLLSLCPLTFRSVPELFRRKKRTKKR